MNTYLAVVFSLLLFIVGTFGKSEQFFEIYPEKLPPEASSDNGPTPFQSVANHDGVRYGCSGLLKDLGTLEISEFFKDDGHHRISLNNESIADLKDRFGLVSKRRESAKTSDLPLEIIYPFSLWPSRCLEEFQFDLGTKVISPDVSTLARWEILSDTIYSQFITLVDFLRKFFGIGKPASPAVSQGHVDVNTGCQYYGVESMDDGDGCLELGVDDCEKKSTRDEHGTGHVTFEESENADEKKQPDTDEESSSGAGEDKTVTIGGGGGGGGGGAFGGFGGSAQGTGIALDGSSAVGVYICNSEHITIIFGTPAPDSVGPSPPKYIGMDEFMIEESYSGNKRIVSITGGNENKSKIIISTDGEVSKGQLTVDGTRNKLKDKVIKRVSKVRVGWGRNGEAILYDTNGRVSRKWRLMKIAT